MPVIKKIRFFFRLISTLVKRYYLILLFGIIFGGLIALIISLSFTSIAKLKVSTKKIGLVGQYTLSNLPNEVVANLSFGLTRFNSSSEIVPGVADKWLIDAEGKRYEFLIIPEKFRWTNGKTFSIDNLDYVFNDVTIEKTDHSIIFSLSDSFAPLPSILTKPVMINGLTGLGDYRLKNYVVKGSIVKTLNLSSLRPEEKTNLQYRFYPTDSDLKTGFNLGEVDYLDKIYSLNNISEGKNIITDPYFDTHSFTALYFNTAKAEFSDKAFRQSLAYAIKKPINDQRSFSSYNPESWAYNSSVKPYNYDINRSLELTPKENMQKTRELIISVLPQDIALAEQIISDFKQIGVMSKYVVINIIPEDYDMLLVSREIPLDPDQYSFWHSTQPGNLSKLRNPRLDKLLEDGRKTIDQESRKNIYLDFQRYLLEECPAVFISYPLAYRVERK